MYSHIPVMLNEAIELLNPQPGQNFVDCTLGGGGHTLEILKRVAPDGKVLGIDLDEKAINKVQNLKHALSLSNGLKVKSFGNNLLLVQDNFANLGKILEEHNFYPVHGILLDLGISSAEYESGRGFSFQKDEPLDMRFGVTSPLPPARTTVQSGGPPQRRGKTAADIVNNWPKEKLIKIFKEYGEERLAVKISDKIVKARADVKIETTKQLADLVFSEYKKAYKNKTFKIHPATKIFQALRIAVNHELENLESVLPQAVEALGKSGRLVVISFHSLEDRIVKQFFAKQSKGCICPPEFPICKCGHKPMLKIMTKKPLLPSDEEINRNQRARSAKLRAAEKLCRNLPYKTIKKTEIKKRNGV